MKLPLLMAMLLPLSSCSPPAERAAAPSPEPSVQDPWLARFLTAHGSDYDDASRIDREKMLALKSAPPTALSAPSFHTRQRILKIACHLIGQTETHGSNRSPLIDKMNHFTGVPLGSPYCASFNAWCYGEGKAPAGWPRSAWSPDWVKSATWTSAKGGKPPQPADAFGIWFASKGRVAHTGLIESWGTASAVTIEGNTSPSAEFGTANDRDGDGIWRKRRLKSQIHSVRDWLGDFTDGGGGGNRTRE